MTIEERKPKTGRAVRMLEVAAAAGVSRSTVSNVMRGHASVAEDVRDRVIQKADELGYIYNRGAASLRMQQSNLVGLVIPDIGNPFIAEAVRGAHEALSDQGYLVTTIETADDPARQTVVLQSLAEHRVDGFIVIPALNSDPGAVSRDLGGLPSVALNRDIRIPGAVYVGPDEVAVARCGAEHLMDVHECSSVSYFGGPPAARPRRERLEEFRRLTLERGVEFVDAWSMGSDATAEDAYARAIELLRLGPPPAGIQCHSDAIAYGLLRALRDSGVSDRSCRVIGCDDLPDSAYFNPSVTSISVDAKLIGKAAAERLLDQFGYSDPATEIPGPHLVTRESCGCHDARVP